MLCLTRLSLARASDSRAFVFAVYNTAVTRKNGPFQKAGKLLQKIVDTSIYKTLRAHVVHLTMKVLSESISVAILYRAHAVGASCAQVESFRAPKPAVLFDRPRDLCFVLYMQHERKVSKPA